MPSEIQPNSNENLSWEPCPSGQLSRLNQQLKSRNQQEISKRRRFVAGLFLVALAPVFLWGINRNINVKKDLGGISCKNVQGHYVAYSHNDLDKKLLTQIKTHLENCLTCQKHYQKKDEEGSKNTAQTFFLHQRPIPERESLRELAFHQPEPQ